MSRPDFSSCDSNSSRNSYIRSKLSSLDFKAFQRVVLLWLGANGYQNIRKLGRSARRGRGAVGPDFLVRVGKDGLDVAVQIRHWRSPLTKRAVDELRGFLLRYQIPAGMIVCPSNVSRAAWIAAADFTGRPIRLIGVDRLAASMSELGLGSSAFFRTITVTSLGLRAKESVNKAFSQLIDVNSPDAPEPDRSYLLLALILACLLLLWLSFWGTR